MTISRILLAASIVASVAGIATAASATPAVETLTWSGTLSFGTDGGPAQFGGASFASLAGDTYSISLSWDPTAAGDGCGASSNTNCFFTLGTGATEIITVNGSGPHTYTATSGGYGLGAGSNDQINFNASGGSQFGLNVNDSTGFFGVTSNANIIGFNFSNITVTGNFGSSNLGGSASLGGSVTKLSATFTPAVTAVPEPATIALFGAGLMGAALGLRRRKARA